jgi:AbrB family looped-hinge helix DNA binding protein
MQTSAAITTMSSKGQLVIPREIRESLAIGAGTKLAVRIEGGRIILQPLTEKLVDEMMGIFAGGASMADELQAVRRAEEKC